MSFNWDTDIRSTLGYDGSNPTRWYCNSAVPALQELTPTFIQTYWDDAKNKVFVGTTPNEYVYADGQPQYDDVAEEMDTYDDDVTNAISLAIYSETLRRRQVIKDMEYYKRKVRL